MTPIERLAVKFAMKLGLESRPSSTGYESHDSPFETETGALSEDDDAPDTQRSFLSGHEETNQIFGAMKALFQAIREQRSLGDTSGMLENIESLREELSALEGWVYDQAAEGVDVDFGAEE